MTSPAPIVRAWKAHVADNPDHIAIEDAHGHRRTRLALDKYACSIAQALARAGVVHGTRVGLLLPRGEAFVAACLACWMSGCSIVPLDATAPTLRMRELVHRARLRVVVSFDRPATLAELTWVDPSFREDDSFVSVDVPDNDEAWCIFTSGSSGTPKGVCVGHTAYVPVLTAQVEAFRITPSSRIGWCLSPIFDASLSDIGTSLLSGATLCIAPTTIFDAPASLLVWLTQLAVTHVDLPPRMLRVIAPSSCPPCVQTIIVGGEPCDPATLRAWSRVVHVVNVYGPTEATICTSLEACTDNWTHPWLGRPIAGNRYHLDPTSSDDEGELWIEGPSLAHGYLDAPELTALRFVQHNGVRFFRTGDQVRRHDDTRWEFLGRLDRQIKRRGQRVDLAEIERILQLHPSVQAAAVVVHDEQLIAWVEPAHCNTNELRAFVSQRLARAAVPTQIVCTNALPRLPSHKVDLVALQLRAPPPPLSPFVATTAHEAQLLTLLSQRCPHIAWNREQSLSAHGVDSVLQLELLVAFPSLPPNAFHDDPDLATLATRLNARSASSEYSVQWLMDDVRKLRVESTARTIPSRPTSILITGASGQLGQRVVAALLATTSHPLVCIARTPLPDSPRVQYLTGHVERPLFGLEPDVWNALAHRTTHVLHIAADVHLLRTYAQLRSVNVVGTQHALQLAHAANARFDLVSTLAVLVSSNALRDVWHEHDQPTPDSLLLGGYAQSKWASEWLARTSAALHVPVVIHRPGLLFPSHNTAHAHDHLNRFIRALARIGCVPPFDPALSFDFTSLESTAHAIAALLEHPVTSTVQTHHLTSHVSLPLTQVLQAFAEVDKPLTHVSHREFVAKVHALAHDPDVALTALSLQHPNTHGLQLFLTSRTRFAHGPTNAWLSARGCPIEAPAWDVLVQTCRHATQRV